MWTALDDPDSLHTTAYSASDVIGHRCLGKRSARLGRSVAGGAHNAPFRFALPFIAP